MRITRRDAMKTGLALAASMPIAAMLQRAGAQTKASEAKAFVTDDTGHRHARRDDVLGATGTADTTVTINTQQPMQTITGFGCALTEAACSLIHSLPDNDRAALLDDLYNPAKTGFSIGRLCVGSSDYSTQMYSYDEGQPDWNLTRFSIDHDRKAVIPTLRQIRDIRPDMYLFACPWSPPGWMKYGGSMLGGSIKPENQAVYARYMIRYLHAYAEAGVNVDAMTIQNELDADQYGRMPACTWPEEIEANYITENLGPLLVKEKLKPQIWMLDHNYDLYGRVLDQLARPHMREFISAIAWHGYAGSVEKMALIQKQFPGLDMHFTEWGDDIHEKHLKTNWAQWSKRFADILANGCKSITTWNLALDETGRPNIGPFTCAGAITIDSHSKAVTRNGLFWALSHYAQAMPRDSKMLACEITNPKQVTASAARRPDGTTAVVLTNSGDAVAVNIDLHSATGASHKISLAKDSVTTVLLS